jgi:hypothetical protein
MVYDVQTRSILGIEQKPEHKTAGQDSNAEGLTKNEDGSYTVYFAPKPPAGKESNWCKPC